MAWNGQQLKWKCKGNICQAKVTTMHNFIAFFQSSLHFRLTYIWSSLSPGHLLQLIRQCNSFILVIDPTTSSEAVQHIPEQVLPVFFLCQSYSWQECRSAKLQLSSVCQSMQLLICLLCDQYREFTSPSCAVHDPHKEEEFAHVCRIKTTEPWYGPERCD